jgi:superfamily I DNA/RNA helicase
VQSFIAALQLGLKQRFGGKVDHLRLGTQDEPGRDGGPRRAYVLLYDSVPGGTGYLHQLLAAMRPAGYAVQSIEADTRVNTEANCLLFATMHRAKGLEFQNVIVTSTTVGKGDRGEVAPQLIYVALTRAKQRAALLTAT